MSSCATITATEDTMEKIKAADVDVKLNSSRRLILDFSSPGCAPCKRISAVIKETLAEATAAGTTVAAYEVDIVAEPALAQRFMVLGVPTVIIFKEGREVARLNSIANKEKLKQLLV